MKQVEVLVYGLDEICPSCVRLPSSKETASWLEAALWRRYGKQVSVRYVDLHHPQTDEEKAMATKILEEDLWYPVVVIAGEVVAEGNPKLKEIDQSLMEHGLVKQLETERSGK